MNYIPNSNKDKQEMLSRIGVSSFDDLLAPVPENLRLKGFLDLPAPLYELELLREITALSNRNRADLAVFAGGGVYDHFIPAAVEQIISRPEFTTAYTPYQAEVSQGTLQVIYEFQTHICRLTGMDVANASMYDGASAAAEAVLLSLRQTKRQRILVSETVSPFYRDVIRTYLSGQNVEIKIIPHDKGLTDSDRLLDNIDDSVSCVVVVQPNFFGLLEDIELFGESIHKVGGHLIAAVDPVAAAVLKTPAECGADIVVGEGQPLGIPLNFGGPLLGFFAVNSKLIRFMPGRLSARTVDADGNPGFVLTLQTREQHIRREKATSNICTNQALCATTATVYLSLLGKTGLKKVALLSMEKTHDVIERIGSLGDVEPCFKGDFVREAMVRLPIPAAEFIKNAVEKYNILPGIDLGNYYPGMENCLLLTVTEKRTDDEINMLVDALKECTADVVLPKV
jgi:glycine cleavage system P protein (glycine dehydrogenase) subunit 1